MTKTMKENDKENRSTFTSNGIVGDGTAFIAPRAIVFTCQICGNEQTMPNPYTYASIFMCNECRSDLKEYVLNKRSKQGKFLGENEKPGQ